MARLVLQEAGQADALARLLVRQIVGERAVPAHAERLAAAGRRRTIGWDDLIAATDRGIAIIGDGSFSIDQQRYNAQFGGQVFYEIKGGKIVGMLKDVAYQMRTPEFWNSMDMIGGKKSYFAGRRVRRRQGTAGQVERGEPRLRAGALPQRQRHQHRADGMSAALAVRSRARYLSREECEALAKRVLSFATADETRVIDQQQRASATRASR